MEKKLIIFALGGTLMLSDDETINVWRQALRSQGLLQDEALVYSEDYGRCYETVVLPKMALKYNWTRNQISAVVNEAKKEFRKINKQLNSELFKKINLLKKSGYSFGILTNRKMADVKTGLEKIKLKVEDFDFIKTSDEGVLKPDPSSLEKVLAKFRPEEIVFIGSDVNKDLPVAKAYGIGFVAISSPQLLGLWRAFKVKDVYYSVKEYLDVVIDQHEIG